MLPVPARIPIRFAQKIVALPAIESIETQMFYGNFHDIHQHFQFHLAGVSRITNVHEISLIARAGCMFATPDTARALA